jgi:hypothetical protein
VKFKLTLSIGYRNAKHEDIVEIDDDELPDNPTQREKYLNDYWQEWAWSFIDGGISPVEENS